jgi:hypothetical protein
LSSNIFAANSGLSSSLSNNIVGAGAFDGPKSFLTLMGKNLYIPMGLNKIGASNPNFISGRRGRRPLQILIDKPEFCTTTALFREEFCKKALDILCRVC